jgi:hypothetical protein
VAFLRHSLIYADSDECRKLENSIGQVEHDTNCAQRVASVTALFGTLLVALLPMVARAAEMKSTYGQRIVAAVLMGEARGEGEIGMTAVAEVIRNRANAASKSPLQIVLKKGGFSCLKDTTPEALHRKFHRMKTYPMALGIAKTCYNTPEQLPNVTKGATFFDSMKKNRPPWLGDVQFVTPSETTGSTSQNNGTFRHDAGLGTPSLGVARVLDEAAAEHLKISLRSLNNWMKKGLITRYRRTRRTDPAA